jgi:hypothetical protein
MGRLFLSRLLNHPLHLAGGDAGRATRPGRVFLQASHPQSQKPLSPTRNLLRGDSQLGGHVLILFSLSRQQHNAGALDQTNRKRSSPRALFQLT